MAATTGGALKQLIEGAGLGLAVYRDKAPTEAVLPYVVVTDGITTTTVPMGDSGADDPDIENVQVDLWEQYMDPNTRRVTEDPALQRSLKKAMNGAGLSASPTHCYGVRVPFNQRTLDADDNTVRTRYSVNVHRAS